jgi:hypothetical protein
MNRPPKQWHIFLACSNCEREGELVWRGTGKRQQLLKLAGGFHIAKAPDVVERNRIVCNACGEKHPTILKPR